MDDNNESKMIKKLMKKDFNKLGITLLAQLIVSNGVIFIVAIGAMIMKLIKNPGISEDKLNQVVESSNSLGILSIVAVLIAFIPILIYRQKKFFQYDLRVKNKKITAKTIIIGFIILISINSILVLFANILELGLNTVGLSANSALENLEILDESTIPMLMYTCIIAPIFEEFIYRGAVLRSLEKYGRKFAIIVSAILFGLMHGNFYQVFMAAGVGIILGYLATEYSIKLTIILHMCNNIFVEAISQITSHVSDNTGNIMNTSILVISIIILIITLIRNKNNIRQWLQNNRMEKRLMLRFLTSITIVIIVAFDLLMVASGITRL